MFRQATSWLAKWDCQNIKEGIDKLIATVMEWRREDERTRTGNDGRTQYTVAEAAEMLGKKPYTVREHCRLGRINATRTRGGRSVLGERRISKEEIRRYREEGLLPNPRKK